MSIHLRTAHDNGNPAVEIQLHDNGPGISAEQAERVFDPYVTTKAKGTGLGLAIVKKIIEEHGGTIRLDPSAPEGAAFTIRLPVAPGAPQEARHG